MRSIIIAATCLSLAACGGPKTNEAQNGVKPAKEVSQALPPSMSPLSGDAAKHVMHERHEGMETIGKANKAIRDELQKDKPDLAVLETNAAKIASLSIEASGWFHAGTGPEAGNTGAKPEIWQSPQDFETKLATFQADARAFEIAAKGGDLRDIKARLDTLGDSCKACHDKYRSKMHH